MPRSLSRTLLIIIEFVAGFAGAMIVLWLLLIWRLSTAPMSLAFLTPYTQAAITSLIPGTQATITNSLLTWDNVDHSITLHADGVHLNGKNNAPIAEIPSLDMRISVFGLMVGRLVPAGLKIAQPKVWLTRDKDGKWIFGGMAAPEGNSDISDSKTALKSIADDLTHAYFMRKLQMTDASFNIHDEITDRDWSVFLPETSLARQLGGDIAGEAKLKVTQDTRMALAVVHYHYDRDFKQHSLSANFSDINPASLSTPGSPAAIVNMPLTGEVSMTFDDTLEMGGGALELHGGEGHLHYPDFWDEPRNVKSFDAKASYDSKTGKLDLTGAEFDFGGPKLSMNASGGIPKDPTSPYDLTFDLSMRLVNLSAEQYAKVWPKPIVPGARDWIVANVSKGMFDRGEASFKGALKWDDLAGTIMTEGNGNVSASNATVTYLDGLPPIVGVNAKGEFDLDKMTVNVSGGAVDGLKLQSSTIKMTDFQKPVQNIELPIKFSGPLPSILRLIDAPRFGYAQAVGLSTDAVTGNFEGMIEMKLPMLKSVVMKDVDIKAGGQLSALASASLVKGINLNDGELTMELDKAGFSLNGRVAIEKVPLLVTWQQAFDENAGKPLKHAIVKGDITGEQWNKLGIDALSNTKGPISVNLEMTQKTKNTTSLTGSLDMKGAELDVAALSWKKPSNTPASLSFSADMPEGKNVNITAIEGQGPGLRIKGKAVLAPDFNPVSVAFSEFIAGRTDATLKLTQAPGPQGRQTFVIDGNAFDVSGLSDGSEQASQPNPRTQEFRVKLNKLYTSETGVIINAAGSAVRDQLGWSQISLHGRADGDQQLDIDLTPLPDGHRTLNIRCPDFGKALKGLGFTDTVKGGKLKITGESTAEEPRTINGKIYIDHFEVRDLPVLVVLMNATSPFGIFNLVTGIIDFDQMLGKFKWRGERLTLDNIRATGDSVGMTINGRLDMDTGVSDLNGTLAPFSMFNRIIGFIPLIGDMINGGEGQGVFGVAYTITGPLNKPNVDVNPASLLTPGFLRNLFFGGGDEEPEEPPATRTTPTVQPALKTPQEAPAPTNPQPPVQTNFNK